MAIESEPSGLDWRTPSLGAITAPTGTRSPARLTAAALLAADLGALLIGIGRYGAYTLNTLLVAVFTIWLLAMGGHYRLRFHLSIIDDAPDVIGRVVFALSLGAAYREFVSGHDIFTADRLNVLLAVASLVVVGRAVVYAMVRELRRRGKGRLVTVSLATEPQAQHLANAAELTPEAGLVLLSNVAPVSACAAMNLSTVDLTPADLVIVESQLAPRNQVPRLLTLCEQLGCDLYIMAPSITVDHKRAKVDHVGWLPLIRLQSAHQSWSWPLKRATDIAVAGLLLAVTAPLIAACALVLRFQSGPGVFFRQERVGLSGRRFSLVKLRTIVPTSIDDSDITWYDTPTSRPTRFARFLRASSMDELPQLWNVIKGEMSMVGPRPERPHFVAEFAASIPDYHYRHRVPVGLTGLAQIHGLRGDTSISERARLDNIYIDTWSFPQDLRILAKTISAVAIPRGGDQ